MGKKAPKAPSPAAQASAQAASDKETSWYNAMLQNMDQITPFGNLTYQNLGTKDAPKWQSTITLSPDQQRILASQGRQDIALNQLGEQQIGRIGQAVSTPFSFGGLTTQIPMEADIATQQQRAEEAYLSRLNPQFDRDEEALRTRLINQGIGQGSEAYVREMNSLGRARNDARQQAILAGQQYGQNAQNLALQRRLQEIEEYGAQRNAPLNEFIGLTSGSQIVNPQFSSGGNTGIGSFNMAGAMRDYYSNQQAAANNRNSAATNLFGLGGQAVGNMFGGPVGGMAGSFLGAGIGSLFSDERIKENIVPVGEENGHKIYEFTYKHIPEKRFVGVMAQDVFKVAPEAVGRTEDGIMFVNYDQIGVKFREVQ